MGERGMGTQQDILKQKRVGQDSWEAEIGLANQARLKKAVGEEPATECRDQRPEPVRKKKAHRCVYVEHSWSLLPQEGGSLQCSLSSLRT